jgi:hypothetical protein
MIGDKTIVFVLLAFSCTVTCAYCQGKEGSLSTSTITGTLTSVDFAGNTIVVNIGDAELKLSVPDGARITGGTEDLGLVGLEDGDPVTVQYYSPSPGRYTAVSIQDNNAYSLDDFDLDE